MTQPSHENPSAARSLLLPCGLALLGGAALHSLLEWRMEHRALRCGVLRPRHWLPWMATPHLSLGFWLLPAVLVVVTFLWFVARAGRCSTSRWLGACYVAFVAIGLSVAMIDGYRPTREGQMVPAFMWTYSQEYEYLQDVPLVDEVGAGQYVVRLMRPAFRERLHMHSRTHPPGAVMFLWSISRVFGRGLAPAALATVLVGALSVFPVYGIGKLLHGEQVARWAVALYLLMPNVVLFTTTSMDGVFLVPLVTSLWLFLRCIEPAASLGWAVLLGGLLFVSSLFTYSAVLHPIFMLLFVALSLGKASKRPYAALRAVLLAGGVALLGYVVLYLAAGYEPWKALDASWAFHADLLKTNAPTLTSWLEVGFINLCAYLLAAGIPVTVLWLGELARAVRSRLAERPGGLFVVSFAVALLVFALSNWYAGETERIWIFLAPFLAVPAAHRLVRLAAGRPAVAHWALGLMAVQTVLAEVVFRISW